MVPLYAKQMKSSAKMSDAQNKIRDIQTRYANNREKMNEEMQKLYSEEGINPTSGCLPLLIQMPILLGLFQLLRNPLTYMTGPDMVVAVHEAFLWVKDLCQPDSWILPILAGASTYFTFSMMPQQEGAGMGAFADMTKIQESIRLIMEKAPDYEFRTTVVAEFHETSDFEEMGKMIAGAKNYFLQSFTDRDTVPFEGFHAPDPSDLGSSAEIMRNYAENVQVRGVE